MFTDKDHEGIWGGHKLQAEYTALEENDTEDTMEKYIRAEEREIIKRRKVIELLGQGQKYYDSLYDEAAYSKFNKKVKTVAVKLAEQQEGLGLAPFPAQAGDIERKVKWFGATQSAPSIDFWNSDYL